MLETGPIAQAIDIVTSEQTTDGAGLKLERWTYVVGFGPKTHDAQDYEAWVRLGREHYIATNRKAFMAKTWKEVQEQRAAEQKLKESRVQ